MFEELNVNRVDGDQKAKENESLQLLVSAGYFRARIKGLNTFDKVIGGMTWCIQGCSMNIDIDLLFQDNWNIGKKIALTEKIVKVLKKMKCPHRIEPHQIQGSDFEHIYPVLQWLVKESFAKKDERVADMKIFACKYFDRNSFFKPDPDSENSESQISIPDGSSYLDKINELYWPQRRYRKPESMRNASEDVSVVSTLLEYGKKHYIGKFADTKETSEDKKGDHKQNEDEENVNEIQAQMSHQVKEGSTKMASKLVSRILEMRKADLAETVEQYAARSLEIPGQSVRVRTEQLLKAEIDFKHQTKLIEEKCAKTSEQVASLTKSQREINETVAQKREYLEELNTKLAENTENVPANIDIIEVENLVKELEQLKEEEVKIKKSMKEEDECLNQKLMKISTEQESGENEEKVAQLEAALTKERKRFQTGRLKLATKTRELKQLELFLDNIPSKREIQQYQKRFVELNDQINMAYSENKQLYDMYNILDSVKDCLQREVNLLNSIHDNIKEAMQNSSSKDQMIKQMETVANTIRDLKKNGENQTERTKAERDQKKSEYEQLLEQARHYARATKQMQETWQLYERLLARAQDMGIEVEE